MSMDTSRPPEIEPPTDRRDDTPNSVDLPLVSVIVPARDAEATIASTLDSILAQDYAGQMEIIVADGSDSRATSEVVRRKYPNVRLVPNPAQTTPNGLNAALRAAAGQIVVRCDTHAALTPEYVRQAVDTLERTGAAVVGGRQRPQGDTAFERAVGMAITTPLGAGDARYRLGGPEGPVDNFYLGVYRRDALDAAGGFDPALVRNQDCELNWRLRKRGDLVWFDPAMTVYYRPRGALRALARQYFDYGRWKPAALRGNLTEVRLRHLASPLLVLGLVASALLGAAGLLLPDMDWALAAAMAMPIFYVAALVLGAVVVGLLRRDASAVLLPVILATMHLSWGVGFFLPARPKRPLPISSDR